MVNSVSSTNPFWTASDERPTAVEWAVDIVQSSGRMLSLYLHSSTARAQERMRERERERERKGEEQSGGMEGREGGVSLSKTERKRKWGGLKKRERACRFSMRQHSSIPHYCCVCFACLLLSPRAAISKASGLACVPALISCGILPRLKPTTLQPDTYTDSLLLSPTADARKERQTEKKREREREEALHLLSSQEHSPPL